MSDKAISFNKTHFACYALMASRLLWLKSLFPEKPLPYLQNCDPGDENDFQDDHC